MKSYISIKPSLGGSHKALVLMLLTACMGAASGVHAAQLTCGQGSAPLRITTQKANWSTDARYNAVVAPATVGTPAVIVDDFKRSLWFDKGTAVHHAGAGDLAGMPLAADWLSFGTEQEGDGNTGNWPYPAVRTNGDTDPAYGSWVEGRVSFFYNEPITINTNVDLSTIRIVGSVGTDDNTLFQVRPASTPSGANDWMRSQDIGSSYSSPGLLNLDGGSVGLGFYYGNNTISFAVQNFFSAPTTDANNPTGLLADFTITADCLTEPEPQPTTALMCPAGSVAGDPVRIGPFTTNARDWKWTWRTNSAGTAVENIEQPLFDSYRYNAYFDPAALTGANTSTARWISPGTTNPGATHIPGLPYPTATGQAKSGYHGSVFVMNQAITVGNNVALDSIKLDGRFAFDDYGNSVFVQPAGGAPVFDNTGLYLPNGYGSFSTTTTPAIPGFARGQNIIGIMLDGGQSTNNCSNGECALSAIADFYVTAACTGEDPIAPSNQSINFPAQSSPRRVADGTFALSPVATASSTLPVAYTSLTPGVCTISGTTVTPVAVGECQIAADQAGGTVDMTIYNAAERVVRIITLQSAPVLSSATPVPVMGVVGLSLLGLLSAGLGSLALRRKRVA